MTLSAAASCPTSVCNGHSGTRLSRLPAAIWEAVFSTTRSGRSARWISHMPTTAMISMTKAAMITWTIANPFRMEFSVVMSLATTTTEPSRWSLATARHSVSP